MVRLKMDYRVGATRARAGANGRRATERTLVLILKKQRPR